MSLNQIEVKLLSSWGGDRDVANAAWASTYDVEKNAARPDADVSRLVSQVVALDHGTPKERVWFDFWIRCPIFVERQFDKYRLTTQFQDFQVDCWVGAFGRHGITQNELSGRYRTMPERAYGLPKDVGTILRKLGNLGPLVGFDQELERQYDYYEEAVGALKAARDSGSISASEFKRAREVLRGVLGTAYLTDMRIVLNAHALEHIINQRLARDAQMESRVVAMKMLQAITPEVPGESLILEMQAKNGWVDLVGDVAAALDAEDVARALADTEEA